MAGSKKTGLIATLAKGGGVTEASLSLLSELGIKNGEWCLDVRPILERELEWFEHAPLFIRVLAALKLHTLAYLPKAGGVFTKKGEGGKAALYLDERRFGHCKKHGALLAITQTTKGKMVAIGPNHLRNEVNEAAERAFTQQEGRAPTDAEREDLFVTPQHLRHVLEFLEDLGICLRTDAEDIPLSELRETEEGRKKLKTLSGDNKIRVYLYLHPRCSKVRQGRLSALPSDEKFQNQKHLFKTFLGLKGLNPATFARLKPLYRTLVIDLQLDIEPEAFVGDIEFQEVVAAKVAAGEMQHSQWREDLCATALAKFPNAAPQVSALSNSTGTEEAGRPSAALNNTPDRESAGKPSAVPNPKTQERVPGPQSPSLAPEPGTADTHIPPADQGRQAGTSASPERDRASRSAPPPLVSQPKNGRPKTAEELAPVHAAMSEVCAPTVADVSQLFGYCRDEAPDCTPEEVAFWVRRVIQKKGGRGVDKWVAYLLAAVPKHFVGPSFLTWREEQSGFDAERKPVKTEESPREILNRLREAARG